MLLFNSFVKKEKDKAVRDHLDGFQDGFSEQQKKAIMLSLFLIANSDGEYHRKEFDFFEMAATLLGYKMKPDLDSQIDEFSSMEQTELIRTLNSLDEGQKDWFIITVFGMIHADGKPFEVEFQYAFSILESIGITEEKCEYVIKKAAALHDFFKL